MMTPEIFVQEADMPTTIAAYTVRGRDETYTIILNSRMSYERLEAAYQHEMGHIANGDFDKEDQELIELEAHGKGVYLG